MAALNWDEIEKENGMSYKEYKDYAPEGVHKTKIESVELTTSKNKGTPGIVFHLAENDDYAFPKYGATAWVSKEKVSWRQHHMKELFVLLGLTEEQARKAVEQCESKEDIGKAYLAMFERAIAKAKEVEVIVFKKNEDDKYTTWDFTSKKVRMNYPEEKNEDMLGDAIELPLDDVLDQPF